MFFGVCTTIVNVVAYWIMAHVINVVVMVSTVVAWFTAIRLAYITNRIWVFHSQASTSKEIFKETSAFFM